MIATVTTLGFGTFGTMGRVTLLGFAPALGGPFRASRATVYQPGGDRADTWVPGGTPGDAFRESEGEGEVWR